jgi:hypothetical protein
MTDTRTVTTTVPRGVDSWDAVTAVQSAMTAQLALFGSGDFQPSMWAQFGNGKVSRDTLESLKSTVESAGRVDRVGLSWHEKKLDEWFHLHLPPEQFEELIRTHDRTVTCIARRRSV